MTQLRKGATIGSRDETGIDHLVQTSVADCRASAAHASRAQLIAAHRWCERNPTGQKTRKKVLAIALRKRIANDELEQVRKGGRR